MTPLGAIDLADPANWDLDLTDGDRALPRRLIAERVGAQSFIAVSLGTKQPANDWGPDNWRIMAELLCRLYPHKLVFIGAEGDGAMSTAVIQGLGDSAINLCGRLTVRESAALIEAAALFIGHDSGPMHLAAAVGTPLVAVFSRLWAPGIWYPWSARAAVLYPSENDRAITPASVLEAIGTVLPTAARKLAGEP
jgi:ADP-heptose:LPS heptosyltransferase